MRVVRIVTRLNRGGPLRQIEALAPGLARQGIAGPVWAGSPAQGEEDASAALRAAGVTVVTVPGLVRGIRPFADLEALRWMRERLEEERPDVVHTHMGKAGALGRLAAWRAGVPVVVHTFHGHHLTAPFPAGLAARRAERFLASRCTAAVCLSERQRHDLVERFRVLPADRAVVLGPGLDVEALRAAADAEEAASIRARLSPDGAPLFLWLGRFVPPKAPGRLLEAAARVPRGALRLVLAGDGPLRGRIERAVRSADLADRVTLVGAVPSAAPWIAACDAVVLASRSEGTPVALLEAMTLGRPVVSTAVGGVPDVVEDGRTGLLVAPGDAEALAQALLRLARDPALARRLGAEGARTAPERFGAQRLVAGTAALYGRLRARRNEAHPPGGR